MELETINLNHVCRTCKCVAPQMRSIFEGYESPHQSPFINEMLMAFASVLVLYDDGLPAQICQVCVEQLRNAFLFKRQCEEIDASLRGYAKNIKVCEIKQEPQSFDFVDIGNNLEVHKKMLESQSKLPTIESRDKIENCYYQNNEDTDTVFSEHSDVDCFEPQVEVMEDMDTNTVYMGLNDEYRNVSESCIGNDKTADSLENVGEGDIAEVKVEDTLEMEDNILELSASLIGNNGNRDSADPEYFPKKGALPKVKRGHHRPLKKALAATKTKISGRITGHPPVKRIKTEEIDKEYGEFPCPACQKVFSTMTALGKHAKTEHEGLKVLRCDMCSQEFRQAHHLRRHIKSHSDNKPFSCNLCTKSFNRKDHLKQHIKSHEGSRDYKCHICQMAFFRSDHLGNHRASKHSIGKQIMNKGYECSLCLESFTTEKSRDIHVEGHNEQKEYTCKVCEKTFSKSDLMEHMKIHNDEHCKKFLCSVCGQRFVRKDYLVIHMRRHTGEMPFTCEYCGKGFHRSTDLRVHERHHTGEKSHLCAICGKGFARSYNLTVHMKTHTHMRPDTGEKSYPCTYCDAVFAQGGDLKTHIRKHPGRRFKCKLCGDSFLVGYLLTQHKQTVHGLNVVSNIRRLQPVHKEESVGRNPCNVIPLNKPVMP